MIAVVQRVSEAAVTVEAEGHRAAIGHGLCVLLGVEPDDGEREVVWMANKIARLRIFRDDDDKMNRSVQDVGGAIFLVSQFTLAGDCRRGNRPRFIGAANPALGQLRYEQVAAHLKREHSVPVGYGIFGAMMDVSLVNDGPVTLIVRTDPPPTA